MTEQLLVGLAAVLVLGTLAQWLAWRLRLPSILLLLLAGFVAGPVTHVLNPDELLGDLLFPAVSLSVAIILFEGGTSLNLRELREVGQVVRRLVSVGVVVTWAIGTAAAYFLLNMPLELSLLLGAILVVSGPTVMMPLLRHVRPTKRVSSALKWEGILIDPVGATLAVLVFEVILAGEALETVPLALVSGVIRTVIIGGVAGVLGAVLLYLPLRRYLIPDSLQTTVTLMMVVAAFVASNHFQPESGLLTVTVMGVILANQRAINIRGIVKFKENLVTVLLSSIFILLAARVQMSDISQLGLNSLLFLAVLIFIARPLTAFVSTIGSEMTWRERAFLGWLAPRGIVAAAVSAIFALELSHIGYAGAEALMPVTLLVIVGTVSIYGLSAAYVARWLKVSQPEPQGVLMVGAHPWAREIALALKDNGITVLLVDSNWGNIHAARMLGLSTYYGNVLSEDTMEDIPLDGIGRLMALTRNDEVNALADIQFRELFGSADVYQLAPEDTKQARRQTISNELSGRILFGPRVTHSYLNKLLDDGMEIKSTPITQKFTFDEFKATYGEDAIPLFAVGPQRSLEIFTVDIRPQPLPGYTVISLVKELPVNTPGNPQSVETAN